MLDQRINDLVDFIALRFRKRLKLVVEQRVFDGITVLEDVAKDGVGSDFQGVEDRNERIQRGELFSSFEHTDVVGAQACLFREILLTHFLFHSIFAYISAD